ncbi:MAG TPA: O-acetyl-ADP-ribose deacetylase [Anaerolineae bacterium]|nr:O-acetyl-ADP-ribose deacetylase [Anaerolineae bacterium]
MRDNQPSNQPTNRVQINNASLELIQADITPLDVDAIVNAANESLLGGGGVDGAIHRAAGPQLLAECRTLGGCPTGEARITKGYRLKARHVIHAVGPIYRGSPRDAELLASAVRHSLRLADEHQLKRIAFPAISTGVYGYPMDKAARVILSTISEHLEQGATNLEQVIMCLYDQRAYRVFERELRGLAE